jgi:hypothetical protein
MGWGAFMSVGKTLAAVLCLFVFCDASAFAKHKLKTGSSGQGQQQTPPSTTPSYVAQTNKIICGSGCAWSDGSRPDVLLRLGLLNPLFPMFPIAFTGRFTVRSFDEAPNWLPRYSSADWTVGGGFEVGLTSNMSLWSELSHTASTGTSGCLECLVSGAAAGRYESNVVRIGFVLRN